MTTKPTIGKRMICFLLAILMIFSQMPTGIISAEAETTYSVTIDSNIQNGTVTASPASSAAEETVTLTVMPDEGYAVSAVSVTADAAQAETEVTRQEDGTYTFTMPAENVTVTAAFKQTYAVNIAGDIENGTVTADQTAASEGDTVTLTVSPEEGFIVSQVKANENEVTADGEGVYSFTMPAENVTVTAAFVEVPLMSLSVNAATADETWGSNYSKQKEFTIEDMGDLLQFKNLVDSGKSFKNKTVKLADGFSNEGDPLTAPIGDGSKIFKGTFDGNGKTIWVSINTTKERFVGLFSALGGCATVKDVTVNGSITAGGTQWVGGIAGQTYGYEDQVCTISGCTNNAAITGDHQIGGICGQVRSYTTISGCTNNAAITGDCEVGGIFGDSYDCKGSSAINCTNNGEISCTAADNPFWSYCGGINGFDSDADEKLDITNCVNNGTVTNPMSCS